MARMQLLKTATVLLLLLAWMGVAFAQQPPAVRTAKDIEELTQTYYEKPRPEIITAVIRALQATRLFYTANAIPPYVGFFSEVFTANPGRVAVWREHIASLQHPTKGVLEWAMSVSKDGGVLQIEGQSAALNDMYWGAFFASGNERYVYKLIEQLRLVDERDDRETFAVGGASKWSLASIARSHARVRAILEAAKTSSDQRTREIIVEVLTRDPGSIRQEVVDISKQRWGGR